MTRSSVSLVEYGIGNIRSVANALEGLADEVVIVSDGDALMAHDGDRIIMPGVGAVGEALGLARERGFEEALTEKVQRRRVPFLGICVGMQMLASRCEEFGTHRGLDWIPGRVTRLDPGSRDFRVPHIGWNTVSAAGPWLEAQDGDHFYFVHSYALECESRYVAAWTDYGRPFVSAVRRGHIMGVQFHPEKSSGTGQALLARFLREELSPAARSAPCSSVV